MPQTITIGVFVLGSVLLLLALSAGGVRIFGAEVSGSAGRTTRVLAGVIGAALILYALFPVKITGPSDDPTATPTPSPQAAMSSEPTPRADQDAAPPNPQSTDVAATPDANPLPVGSVTEGEDSVRIIDVRPLPGTIFKRGTPQSFHITLGYFLASDDAAILSVSVAQSPASSARCNSNAGHLTDAIETPIVRGRHTAEIDVTWSGDTEASTKGHVDGRGFLSFVPMFWRSVNGQRADRIEVFKGYQALCYSFGS